MAKNSKLKLVLMVVGVFVALILATILEVSAFRGMRYYSEEWFSRFALKQIPEEALEALETAVFVDTIRVDPTPEAGRDGHRPVFAFGPKTTINDPASVQRLMTAIKNGVANPSIPAACFTPRHAVEVKKGPNTYIFLLCYECNRMRVLWGAEQMSSKDLPFGGDLKEVADLFAESAQPAE